MVDTALLRAVYVAGLRNGTATPEGIATELTLAPAEASARIDTAIRDGLLAKSGTGIGLTVLGRGGLRFVMIGGAFEIIHPGHIHTIAEAKKLGDTLVVVVAADRTVSKNKGRDPVTPQEWRVRLISALRDVDIALPGGLGSIYDTLEKVKPDIVALGYDQKHNPEDIENEAARRGMKVRVTRLTSPLPDVKTSKIVGAI
jgi:FAD synthetase